MSSPYTANTAAGKGGCFSSVNFHSQLITSNMLLPLHSHLYLCMRKAKPALKENLVHVHLSVHTHTLDSI